MPLRTVATLRDITGLMLFAIRCLTLNRMFVHFIQWPVRRPDNVLQAECADRFDQACQWDVPRSEVLFLLLFVQFSLSLVFFLLG